MAAAVAVNILLHLLGVAWVIHVGRPELVGSWQFLLVRTSLLLCVVQVYLVLLNALNGIEKQAILQE